MSALLVAVAAQPAVGSASLGPALFQLFGIIGALVYFVYSSSEDERKRKKQEDERQRKINFWKSKKEQQELMEYTLLREQTKEARMKVAQAKFEASLIEDAEKRKSYFGWRKK